MKKDELLNDIENVIMDIADLYSKNIITFEQFKKLSLQHMKLQHKIEDIEIIEK